MELRIRICSPIIAALAVTPALSAEGDGPSRLTWNNGESLPGELAGATETDLTWKSPLFGKPVSLNLAALRSVTSDAKATLPDGSMMLNLRDGSRIYGDLAGVDGEWLSVKSGRHGVIRIRRRDVVSIHRLKGGSILWCGPSGEAGWKYASTKTEQGQRLQSVAGGILQSVAWRQRSTLPLDLPEQVEIEFRLGSTVQPEFELEAAAGKRVISLTTWKDELVLRRGNHFISIANLSPDDREVNLRLFWDRKAGNGMIATAEGKLLGKWQSEEGESTEAPKEKKPAEALVQNIEIQGNVINRIAAAVFPGLVPAEPSSSSRKKTAPVKGVSLTNRGPELQLKFLRVRQWDGTPPERTVSNPFRTRLELAGAPGIEGMIVGGTAESLRFKAEAGASERTIPVEKVESLYFSAEPLAEEDAPSPADEFRFADGTWLRGRFLGIEDGSARIESPFCEAPVLAKMEGLRELRILSARQEGEDEKEPLPLAQQDKLVTGKTTIHGTWHPAEGNRIQWRLAGAAGPVEIASTAEMELTRVPSEDGDWPRAPALFHLSNGQIAPGDLVTINGGKNPSVEFRSELFDSGSFSADDLHAIQFRGPEVKPEGFEDPGWQIVRGGKKAVQVKEGTVTIDPGGSWGHPSILVGDEIRFTIQPSGYGTLRVRLFTDGIGLVAPSTNILLAHYGNEIYCGLEETPGQLNQRRDVSVGSNKPAKIRLNWDNTATKVYVNGTMAVRIPNDKKAKRSGLGLIFEPANLWGNGERQMKVNEFSLRAAPGITWVPGINPVAKERALFLPRFRKEDPPMHMLLAPNGDVLRGTIVAAAGERIGFRSGLEELSIPRDRVAAAIWLKPPPDAGKDEAGDDEPKSKDDAKEEDAKEEDAKEEDKEEEDKEEEDKEEEDKEEEDKEEQPKGPEPTHWLLLTSGARLGIAVESFGPDFVTGNSQMLGTCRIPAEHVHLIQSTKPETSPATLAFSNWQLKRAPEPLAEGGGDNSPMIGNDAPEIDLAMLDGSRFRLSEEKGKVVVLDFWATWCGPCVRAIPDMIREFSSLDRSRVRFVGVNQAEAPALIEPFIKQRGWNPFEVALDVETSAGQAFGVEGIPHTVIVDHEGKVAWVSTGFKPNGAREAADAVRELLGEAPDRTAQFMQAEDIENLDIQAGRFASYVGSFLGELVSSDPAKALEIFEKAVEIVETSRERDLWKLKPGDQSKSFAADVVIHLKAHAEPVAWLAFQADLIRSKKVPPFELVRIWSEKKLIDALVGSESTPKVPIETSVRAVAEAVGNPELLPLAAPLLYKIVQRHDLDTIAHLLLELNSRDQEELAPLLEELKRATDLLLRMREGYRGRHYSPEANDHYVGALEDKSIPLPVRLLLADFLATGATPYPSREIALACAEAVGEAWESDTPVVQFWLQPVLDNFMRETRDDAWKAVARQLGKGFRTRYLGESPLVGIPNVPDDDLLNVMMDLHVTIDNVATAKNIYEKFPKRFVDFRAPMFHFIRAGEFELAGEVLTSQGATFGRKQFRPAAFDELLEEKSAAFLETVENPGYRMLAEAMIAGAPDPLEPGHRTVTAAPHGSPKSLRLQAVAKQYDGVDFPKAAMRRQVLGVLGSDVAAARIVGEALREEAEDMDLDAVLDAKKISIVIREGIITKPDLGVFEGALLLEMADGKLEAVDAMLDRVAEAEVEVADRKHIFVERIFDLPGRAIFGSADPAMTAEALIPLCKRIALGIEGLEPRPTVLERHRQPWAQLTYAMLEAGKMNEFFPWFRGTEEGKIRDKRLALWKEGTLNFMWFASERYRGQPVEKRVEFLKEFSGQDWVVDGFHSFTNSGFRSSGSVGLLSLDELLEHGESIAEASPRKGHAFNDLGYVFEVAGKFDQAAEYWQRASQARLALKVEGESWRYRAHSVRALYRQGRIDDAAKAISEIPPEKYNSPDFDRLRKRISSGEAMVSKIEEWESMAETAFAGAEPIAAKAPREPAETKKESSEGKTETDVEPDPFAADMKKPAAPAAAPDATGPSVNFQKGGDKEMDEPDPFAPAPAPSPVKKEKIAAGNGDEPDPFGNSPKNAPAKNAKPAKEADGDEPDPFGAP